MWEEKVFGISKMHSLKHCCKIFFKKCFFDFLIILFIDPCENIPCQNNGKCAAFKDKSGFRCICDERHNGLLCEKGTLTS